MDLVTGGTGIVGSRIIFDLLQQGKKVRATFRSNSQMESLNPVFEHWQPGSSKLLDQIQWVEADLLDVEAFNLALEGVTRVYHAAAVVSFKKKDRDMLMKINGEGTANVVNCCLESSVEQLCFVSSVAAIGRSKPGEVIHEDIMWKNSPLNSQYAISKYSGERELWRGMEEGLNVCVVNPCIVVGPSTSNRSSMQIFHTVWKGMPFYTSGSNGFIGVEDVARACTTLMDEKVFGERFVLCSANLMYREFFTRVANALGKKPPSRSVSVSTMKLGWAIESFAEWLGLRKATLTRESIRSAANNVSYIGDRITEKSSFKYSELNHSIERTATFFLDRQT